MSEKEDIEHLVACNYFKCRWCYNIINQLQKYRKTASVKAIKMNVPFKVMTLEGIMKGRKGDYLCIGIKNERWSVKKDIFEKTYEKIMDE